MQQEKGIQSLKKLLESHHKLEKKEVYYFLLEWVFAILGVYLMKKINGKGVVYKVNMDVHCHVVLAGIKFILKFLQSLLWPLRMEIRFCLQSF